MYNNYYAKLFIIYIVILYQYNYNNDYPNSVLEKFYLMLSWIEYFPLTIINRKMILQKLVSYNNKLWA